MKPFKLHSGHIECAVAELLNYRLYTIVPNVSYGLGLNHECDLLALDKKDRFTEVEIKISVGDLRADFKKGHGHKSEYISRLVYALPIELIEKHGDLIPKEHGIIAIEVLPVRNGYTIPRVKASWYRIVKCAPDKKVSEKVIKRFMMLGCMRIWSLKNHNNNKLNLK